MLRLVGHVGSKVTAYNAMPSGVVLFVKLLLDVGRDVLLDVVLLESLAGRSGRARNTSGAQGGMVTHARAHQARPIPPQPWPVPF